VVGPLQGGTCARARHVVLFEAGRHPACGAVWGLRAPTAIQLSMECAFR